LKINMFLRNVLIAVLLYTGLLAADKPRLRRSDSFFGLHFDLHANESIHNAGASLSEAMIDSLLEAVKPDFIQVDCKGHPGISSYPTKIGTPVPGFVADPLRRFRDVTARHGVSLYVHYSGVWDSKAIERHPYWGQVDSKGQIPGRATSFYSQYADSLLIPQMKELIDVYHIDGAWIDGECWAVVPDYSPAALAAFRNETGISTIPKTPDDPDFAEWLQFTRKNFRVYLRRYIDILHAYHPDFQVTSNWAFSAIMPEPVDINLDYLSGDFSPSNSVYNGAFEARCLASQGKPWDLMAWSFSWNGKEEYPHATKSLVQLQQEAAQVLAMGGGFQTYFRQNEDLSIQPWCIPLMTDLAKFCRQRQPFTHKSKPVPQIGLVYASKAYQREVSSVYSHGPQLDRLAGVLNAILDNQKPVEILMDHHLHARMSEYPLLVLAEWSGLAVDYQNELLEYVEKGGKLLIIGAAATEPFTPALHVQVLRKPEQNNLHLYQSGQMTSVPTRYLPVQPQDGARVMVPLYRLHDLRYPAEIPAATCSRYGKGLIAATYMDLGKLYLSNTSPAIRNLVGHMIDQMLPEQKVRVMGSHLVQVCLNTKNGYTYIHLLNVGGQHKDRSVCAYDELPALGPLTVEMSGIEKKPAAVYLQPEGKKMDYTWRNGKLIVVVPRLDVHTMVEVRN
jgi:hypothetical protein